MGSCGCGCVDTLVSYFGTNRLQFRSSQPPRTGKSTETWFVYSDSIAIVRVEGAISSWMSFMGSCGCGCVDTLVSYFGTNRLQFRSSQPPRTGKSTETWFVYSDSIAIVRVEGAISSWM